MKADALARLTAIGRIAIGGAFLVRPESGMRPWIGRDARTPGAQLVARALGARDLVLGVGTLAADRRSVRSWLTGALVADTADLLLTVAGADHVPPRGRLLVAGLAGGGVVLGAAAIAGTRS